MDTSGDPGIDAIASDPGMDNQLDLTPAGDFLDASSAGLTNDTGGGSSLGDWLSPTLGLISTGLNAAGNAYGVTQNDQAQLGIAGINAGAQYGIAAAGDQASVLRAAYGEQGAAAAASADPLASLLGGSSSGLLLIGGLILIVVMVAKR